MLVPPKNLSAVHVIVMISKSVSICNQYTRVTKKQYIRMFCNCQLSDSRKKPASSLSTLDPGHLLCLVCRTNTTHKLWTATLLMKTIQRINLS